MVTGHGDRCGGHYRQWIRKALPDWESLYDPANELPHSYSCPQAFRTPGRQESWSMPLAINALTASVAMVVFIIAAGCGRLCVDSRLGRVTFPVNRRPVTQVFQRGRARRDVMAQRVVEFSGPDALALSDMPFVDPNKRIPRAAFRQENSAAPIRSPVLAPQRPLSSSRPGCNSQGCRPDRRWHLCRVR